MADQQRYVLLIECDLPKPWSSQAIEAQLRDLTGQPDLIVWGCIDGVDAAYRKLRQLSAETERNDSIENRVHSAHKALSFFRDMFPPAFWRWKRIGGEHPTPDERPMMAGR